MKVERDVAAPAELVWAIITDLERTTQLISAITALERLDDGTAFGIGTRWKETRVMFGRSSTEEMEVTAVDPGHSYTVELDAAGAHYTSVMAIAARGDGSTLSMTFDAEATSLLSRLASLLGRLFEGSTRKALMKDLDEIAAEAERSAATEAPPGTVG